MNNQPRTIISDWGIEDYLPASPNIGYFQPLKFINGSFLSHHSLTDSVNSNQSQYRNDSITDTTSMLDSPVLDKSSYKDFLDDYGMERILKIKGESDDLKFLIVGRNFLHKERGLMSDILDQFNYNIITSDLIRNDTKLTYMKLSLGTGIGRNHPLLETELVQLSGYSLRFMRPRFKIILLLISMVRYLIRQRSSLLIKLTVSILIKSYSIIKIMSTRLKLFKMMKMLNSFMDTSFQLDNKVITIMNHLRELQLKNVREEIAGKLGGTVLNSRQLSLQDYLIFQNGLSLLTINYNQNIKKLLPYLDVSCLEKYLNIYKMDFANNDLDFIWILNHSMVESDLENVDDFQKKIQIGQDHLKRQLELEKLVKNYILIRKFYLCCLLTMGELDITNDDEIFFKQLIETKFNFKFEEKYSSLESKISRIIDSLQIEHIIRNLNEQIKQNEFEVTNQGKEFKLIQFEQNPHDKLISRMDKIINNMRYLRYKGYDIDRQTGQDLNNLVQLYNNTNRTLSNPVELKRYSMPTIPKQRIRVSNRERDITPGGNNSKRLSNGLSFNLLTAVLEDKDSHVVSFDDNYVKLNTQSEETVIMHDIAHSTMLDMDMMEDLRGNEEIIKDEGDEDDDDEDNEQILMSQEEMKLKLSKAFDNLYH